MRGARYVRVRQDGEELGRGAPEHPGRVHVTHRAGERRGHRLERVVGWKRAVDLDEEHAEVALIAVRARELVFEDGAHEAIVEQACGAVDDVQRLGLWVVRSDSARGAKHGFVRER